MGTIRYANPAGSNTSPYDTVAKGATDPQTILDLATAGDECRLVGTFVHGTHFTGPLTIDTNAGSATTGFIKVVGVNASGNNDGTLSVIDGDDAGLCLQFAGKWFWWFENLDITQSSGEGIDDGSTDTNGNIFINCRFHDCATAGIGGYRLRYALFLRCAFYNNTDDGIFQLGYSSRVMFCSLHDNGGDGIYARYNVAGLLFGCIIYDNAGFGIQDITDTTIIHCSVDGNTLTGVDVQGSVNPNNVIIGNRFTNHPAGKYGIDFTSLTCTYGYNYYEDNAGGHLANATYAQEILVAGVGTDDEDNADTNEGYTSKTDGLEDFNLRSDASLRRTAITIPTSA